MSPASRLKPAHRAFAAWLAALAMLLFALAPSVTRVLASADAASWVSVCTIDGLVQVQLLESGERIPNPAEHVAQADCPYCALQGHALVLPSSLPRPALPAVQSGTLPPSDAVVHWGATPWPPAQARAPPRA